MYLPPDCQAIQMALPQRRQRLSELIDIPVVLWSGRYSPRNFPANTYPFRASSHFLYFAGLPLENAAIRLEGERLELFLDEAPAGNALWHGEMPQPSDIAEWIGADGVFPHTELEARAQGAATVRVQHPETQAQQVRILQRSVPAPPQSTGIDRALVEAIVTLRLTHDQGGLAELRKAGAVTVAAHKAGMAATQIASLEAGVRGTMEGVILSHNMTCSYNSIVTVHGEVLHNEQYCHPLQPGNLLLADVGAETPLGWAADVTRTWPVSGQFSPTQREIYQIVLAAHDACIEQIKSGVEYQEIHLLGARVIAAGLVDLGILRGAVEDLVEQDAHALFFPHGIGHVLGLDVHDMEDLGDLAGYAAGRRRSQRFGLKFLRLNRPLKAGMLVTIEPGFYQVPGILNDSKNRDRYHNLVNWERLDQFSDVRGIRIEDDVWVTETGTEVLTRDLPTQLEEIETLINHR
ncbi:MAG: aminopeptidase P family protein [Oscillatoriales cyanobacterium RM2_1_1]|nr:aminopeptidase P family protein [Oscillatoriales cyanobacterium SM2_3_0]NJO46317.1 aminopeptidase P family protein [Oscillatoriales cyanobacterium RM2_1_1]